jgi:hypothetical protein
MSALTIKSLVKSITIVGTLSACVGLVASATPASAAGEFVLYGSKTYWPYNCVAGQYGVELTTTGPIAHVANGCSGRVWLHQYKGGTGWTYCITPGATFKAIPSAYQNPYGVSLSTNGAAC